MTMKTRYYTKLIMWIAQLALIATIANIYVGSKKLCFWRKTDKTTKNHPGGDNIDFRRNLKNANFKLQNSHFLLFGRDSACNFTTAPWIATTVYIGQ